MEPAKGQVETTVQHHVGGNHSKNRRREVVVIQNQDLGFLEGARLSGDANLQLHRGPQNVHVKKEMQCTSVHQVIGFG